MEEQLLYFIINSGTFKPLLLNDADVRYHNAELLHEDNEYYHVNVFYFDNTDKNIDIKKDNEIFEVIFTYIKYMRVNKLDYNCFMRKLKIKNIINK